MKLSWRLMDKFLVWRYKRHIRDSSHRDERLQIVRKLFAEVEDPAYIGEPQFGKKHTIWDFVELRARLIEHSNRMRLAHEIHEIDDTVWLHDIKHQPSQRQTYRRFYQSKFFKIRPFLRSYLGAKTYKERRMACIPNPFLRLFWFLQKCVGIKNPRP